MTYPSNMKPESYNGFNRGPYHPSSQRFLPLRPSVQPMLYRVCLSLGDDLRFQGEGQTCQLARHDAAAKALAYYKNSPAGDSGDKSDQPDGSVSSDLDVSDGENKSRISLLYEVALKRGLTLDFKVVSETGPPHLRTFVTQCTLGEFMTEGEGSGKKLSKKKAAEKMLEELKKNNMLNPPINALGSKLKNKTVLPKKKPKNLVKDTTPVHSEECALAMDPVSRLMQLQQARKGREPVFTLISDKGNPRKPEFVVQVSVDQKSCIGTGAKKKLAKKAAAQKMLEKLLGSESGRSCVSDVSESNSTKSIIQLADALQEINMSTMSDKTDKLGSNQQPVPGVLVMPKTFKNESGIKAFSPPSVTPALPTSVPSMGVRPEIQLKYLAEIEGFTVHYEDFPKANRSVFLSLVTVSTNPPQVHHGVGATLEESRDQAKSGRFKHSDGGRQGTTCDVTVADDRDTSAKVPSHIHPLLPPDADELENVAPQFVPTFNLASYVNKSPLLQEFVKLGVELHKWDKKPGVSNLILRKRFDEDIAPVLRFLVDNHVHPDSLGRVISKNPLIFREDQDSLQSRVEYLYSKRFTGEMVGSVLTKNPYWLNFSVERIDRRLGFFQTYFGLKGSEVRQLAVKNPKLITWNLWSVKEVAFTVKEEMAFGRDETKHLLLEAPRIFHTNRDTLVRRFEVVHKLLKLPNETILNFPQLLTTREFKLKERHLFLQSLGKAQYNPTRENYVSPLDLSLPDDSEFCTKVAKVPVHHFNDFLKTL
nr:EOG090X0C5Y [Triops cancriformis]